jgi:hypothetical protein
MQPLWTEFQDIDYKALANFSAETLRDVTDKLKHVVDTVMLEGSEVRRTLINTHTLSFTHSYTHTHTQTGEAQRIAKQGHADAEPV